MQLSFANVIFLNSIKTLKHSIMSNSKRNKNEDYVPAGVLLAGVCVVAIVMAFMALFAFLVSYAFKCR